MKIIFRTVITLFFASVSLVDFSIAEEKKISLKERKTWSFEKLEEYQKTLKNVNTFYGIGELLNKAYGLKKWEKVGHYAPIYLQEAEKYKNDWNYGNAIFYSNIVMSEMAYDRGEVTSARELLIKASETPGSPQLDSFGPFIGFQREYLLKLAKAGEKDILIQFAKNCKKFVGKKVGVRDENPDIKVTQWNLKSIDRFIDQIQKGTTPDFEKPD